MTSKYQGDLQSHFYKNAAEFYRTCGRRFVSPFGFGIENVELYRSGGFHPVSIGDLLCKGRYKVVHKLGSGGSSTVWLARDYNSQELVTLKIFSAEASFQPTDEIPDLVIPRKLSAADGGDYPSLLVVKDSFTEEGPNGTHLCLTYELHGPPVSSFAEARHIRGDLARKVAKQTAAMIERMHTAGFVHGDITASNILFRLTNQVRGWSDEEIYRILGEPQAQEIQPTDGFPPGPCAPRELVEPINGGLFSIFSLLQENVVVIDFGQSFSMTHIPKNYCPGTAIHYMSPETRFESRATAASDIWGLACATFEIRAGFPLFDPFFPTNTYTLGGIVDTLGELPEPWWSAFESMQGRSKKNGESGLEEVQNRTEIIMPIEIKDPIPEKLRRVGERLGNGGNMITRKIGDQIEFINNRQESFIETLGKRLDEEEISLLSDLLLKMLKYSPEERITIQEVLRHPWFQYTPAP